MVSISELLDMVYDEKLSTNYILDKLISYHKMNNLVYNDNLKFEYEGYYKQESNSIPEYRKFPFLNITYEFSDRFSKGKNIPLIEFFINRSEALNFLKACCKISLVCTHLL